MFRRSFLTSLFSLPFLNKKKSEKDVPLEENQYYSMLVEYSNNSEYWQNRALLAEKDLDFANRVIEKSLTKFVTIYTETIVTKQNDLYHLLNGGNRPPSHEHFGTYLDGNDPLLPQYARDSKSN